MFKFSCADYTFPVLDRTTTLHLLQLLGFTHVDIGLFARSSHFSPTELIASPRSYTKQVLRDLKAAELGVSDVFVQIGVDPSECSANDPSRVRREKNREVFARSLEFCVAIGSKHLTGLPGVFHPKASVKRNLELAAEEAARRVKDCADAGVRYAIEPHVGSIRADVKGARAFLNMVEGLTLTLDYGHFVMAGETSIQAHSLLDSASHIHVRGGALRRLQTSVAENEIDFPAMLAELQRIGYDGFLALEYVWIDWNGCNRTDNISETILLRNTLEASMAGLAKNAKPKRR
jgi:sugar phosphate isomerase/epimerase